MKPEELLHLFSPYLPTDRFRALLRHSDLPLASEGAALMVDISGFTPLTTQLVVEYGPERASEELQRRINPMFEAIAGQVFNHGGSVIRFMGDGFIAWFDDHQFDRSADIPATLRAISAGLEMQSMMRLFRGLKLKVCVGRGQTHRWVVGQPQHGLSEVLLGSAVEEMLSLVAEAQAGQVIIHRDSIAWLRKQAVTLELADTGNATVSALPDEVASAARRQRWTAWAAEGNVQDVLSAVRPFVDSAIRERVETGFGDYVGELRNAVPMFIQINSVAPEFDGARELLDNQVRTVQSVLASFGGRFVSAEVGDKGSVLFAVFGAPISYGDDAERAVRAAMALRDMSASTDELSVERIGISRGLLYAGTVGGEVRHEYSTIGDETNVASRLMTAASTGQILTTSKVRSEVGSRVAFHELPPLTIKGRAEPIPVTEPTSIHVGSQQQTHLGELVGRESELGQLHKVMNAVVQGFPRIVRIEGQAGIGKSRLVSELVRLTTAQNFRAAGGDCLSTGSHIAYLPWRDILVSLLDLNLDADPEVNLLLVEDRFEQIGPEWLNRLPLLADLLELPISDTPETAALEERTRHQALFALITDLILYMAQHQPLLLIIEDTHWIDEVSEALTIDLARRLNVEPAPVMLVLVHRPLVEADHPQAVIAALGEMHFHSHMVINDLSRSAVNEMIEKYLDASIPPELAHFVYNRAHGNPFFIQAVIDTLVETGHIKVIGSIAFIEGDLQSANLPQTVQKLVQARIDRLNDTDKLVLKVAAVIGQEFQVSVLAKSIPIQMDYGELLERLRSLEERDFSYQESPEPELTYLFKHAITQEVTYQSLLFAQRRQLHQAVAATLVILAPEATAQLAYHFARSGDDDQARHYLLLAGEKSFKEYANQAALSNFTEVQALARNDDELFEINRRRLQILMRLGDMQTVQKELPELQELASRHTRPEWQATVQLFWAQYYTQTSAWLKVIDETQTAITFAKQLEDETLLWEAYLLLRAGYLGVNQREAAEHLNVPMHQIVERLGDPHRRAKLTLLETEDLFTQNPAQAVQNAQSAIEQADSLHDAALEADGWSTLARFYSRANSLLLAQSAYERQIELLRQIGERRNEGLTLLNIGRTRVNLGELSEGNAHLLDAFKILHQIGERAGEALSLVNLGIIAQHHQAYDEALAYMQRGLVMQRTLDTQGDIAITLFSIGNTYVLQGAYSLAQEAFEEAKQLFVANGMTRYLAELSAAVAELDLADNNLTEALSHIDALLPSLQQGRVIDLLIPGLAYLRSVQVLERLNDNGQATRLREIYRVFIDNMFADTAIKRRETFINKLWYNAALYARNEPDQAGASSAVSTS